VFNEDGNVALLMGHSSIEAILLEEMSNGTFNIISSYSLERITYGIDKIIRI
jgi:hypothetical protein